MTNRDGNNPESPPPNAAPELSENGPGLAWQNSAGTLFEGEHRMHLQHTEPGDEAIAGSRLNNSFDELTADFTMVKFGDRAGVKKNGQRQLASGVSLGTNVN